MLTVLANPAPRAPIDLEAPTGLSPPSNTILLVGINTDCQRLGYCNGKSRETHSKPLTPNSSYPRSITVFGQIGRGGSRNIQQSSNLVAAGTDLRHVGQSPSVAYAVDNPTNTHPPAISSCARATQKSGLLATGIWKNCWLFSAQICSSIGC